ncbi:MAG: AAA family ATPase [Candidatus Aminicenantes bacterium]|nr:AAA family ATPase [Candidatus Aminicenantes bacterium]
MKPKIDTLTIERFRVLRQLQIDGLGRINLITGRNNTGKSSVLEALRILASDASPAVINNILRYREEDFGESEEPTRHIDAEGLLQISSLFHGFPQPSDKSQAIVISAKGRQPSMRLTLEVAWVSEERGQEGQPWRLVPGQRNLFGESDGIPALVVETGGVKRILTLDNFRRYGYRGRIFRPDLGDESSLPCVFVSPYGGEHTATLGVLWDKIALSDLEKDVVEALRIIDPEISAVSMVGPEGPRQQRTAIVRAGNLPRPVPLRTFGDGLNRLFGIVLSLVNAKNGLLLIDEFENGMHHTVQLDVWRAVFDLSRRLDIQVFATSHSWDAVETFQEAAAETPGEGVLVRLSRKGEAIIPTIFAEDELAIAARDRIEVR